MKKPIYRIDNSKMKNLTERDYNKEYQDIIKEIETLNNIREDLFKDQVKGLTKTDKYIEKSEDYLKRIERVTYKLSSLESSLNWVRFSIADYYNHDIARSDNVDFNKFFKSLSPVCDVNEELCAKCGGECCKIFLHCPETADFADHVEGWGEVLGKVPKEYPKIYDLNDYYTGKSIPVECPYLGVGGCLITKREDRPRVCLEYKCEKWKTRGIK